MLRAVVQNSASVELLNHIVVKDVFLPAILSSAVTLKIPARLAKAVAQNSDFVDLGLTVREITSFSILISSRADFALHCRLRP